MALPGRLYKVTVQLGVEPGPSFEEKSVTVRAYDVGDAIYSALLKISDPRVSKVVGVEPASDESERALFDLERMMGGKQP